MATTKQTNKLQNGSALQQQQYNQNLIKQQQLQNQLALMNMAEKNPWMAAGNILGTILMNRYNDRGIRKETDELRKQLEDYKGDNNYVAKVNALNNIPAAVPADVVNTESVANRGNTIPQESAPSTEEQGITFPSNGVDASQTPNPTGRGNIGAFNAKTFKAEYFNNALKRGRPLEQVQAAWDNMAPEVEALTEQSDKSKLQTVLSSFNKDANGNYDFGELSASNPGFVKQYAEIADTHPQVAALLLKNAITADTNREYDRRAQMTESAQARRDDRTLRSNIALKNIDNNNRLKQIALSNQGKVDVEGASKQLSLSDYVKLNEALDKIKKRNSTKDALGNETAVPRYEWKNEGDINMANAIDKALGNKVARDPRIPPNGADYNDVTDWLGAVLPELTSKPGADKKKVVAYLKNYLSKVSEKAGGSSIIDKALNDVNWEGYGMK